MQKWWPQLQVHGACSHAALPIRALLRHGWLTTSSFHTHISLMSMSIVLLRVCLFSLLIARSLGIRFCYGLLVVIGRFGESCHSRSVSRCWNPWSSQRGYPTKNWDPVSLMLWLRWLKMWVRIYFSLLGIDCRLWLMIAQQFSCVVILKSWNCSFCRTIWVLRNCCIEAADTQFFLCIMNYLVATWNESRKIDVKIWEPTFNK